MLECHSHLLYLPLSVSCIAAIWPQRPIVYTKTIYSSFSSFPCCFDCYHRITRSLLRPLTIRYGVGDGLRAWFMPTVIWMPLTGFCILPIIQYFVLIINYTMPLWSHTAARNAFETSTHILLFWLVEGRTKPAPFVLIMITSMGKLTFGQRQLRSLSLSRSFFPLVSILHLTCRLTHLRTPLSIPSRTAIIQNIII